MSPEKEGEFSLIITNMRGDQQAIVARQEKMETLLNQNQVLLATMAKTQEQHAKEMDTLLAEMRDMKKDSVDLSTLLSTFKTQMDILKFIAACLVTLVIGYAFAHFVK